MLAKQSVSQLNHSGEASGSSGEASGSKGRAAPGREQEGRCGLLLAFEPLNLALAVERSVATRGPLHFFSSSVQAKINIVSAAAMPATGLAISLIGASRTIIDNTDHIDSAGVADE